MALGSSYIGSDDLASYFGLSSPGKDEDEMDAACAAASRWVETYCRRQFNVADEATPRLVRSYDGFTAWVDDIATTDDLVLEADTASDGTYATAVTDYFVDTFRHPDGSEGPIIQLVTTGALFQGGYTNPTARRPYLRVTALWGWPEVPANVRQATKIVAAELFKLKDAPFGVLGVSDFGPLRIGAGTLGRAQALLDPYSNPPVVG